MREYKKPLPDTAWEQGKWFWAGCKRQELRIQRCDDCGAYIWYPRLTCHSCHSTNLTWTKVSGKGEIYSWTTIYHPVSPVWEKEIPYIVAIVELEEGVRLASNLIDCQPQWLYIGMPVEVVFEEVTEEVTLPKFRPTPHAITRPAQG